jgi:hypothetical protein
MNIPESALLNSLRTMNEATQTWSNDRSHLHGFSEGWKTCLITLLRVYGEPETIKQLAGLAEVCSVKATTVANPDLETQILVGSANGGVA